MQILILRFDAPLMSFGGVMVDQHGPTDRFPGLSMLAGLFGNALGLRHAEFDKLQQLQARIEYAARWDLSPEALLDYHTVDLGQAKMCEPGWTSRGVAEHRAGGAAAKFGTHQRYRHYWANGVMTLAVTLTGDDEPTLTQLQDALRQPVRPLFLGRKTCLPSTPLLLESLQASDVLQALRDFPLAARASQGEQPLSACWPAHLSGEGRYREVVRYDQREWRNQIHAGERRQCEGQLGRPGL